MGNLKGKECGKGICQRKDGQYYASFVSKGGKHVEDYFATHTQQAIERDMQPKVPKKLLGNASIKTTMDRYVNVTDDSLLKGVRQFESYQTA